MTISKLLALLTIGAALTLPGSATMAADGKSNPPASRPLRAIPFASYGPVIATPRKKPRRCRMTISPIRP
jgi:hypothetical protein